MGNSISRAFGIFFGVFAFIKIFSDLSDVEYAFYIPMLVGGIAMAAGKEMVDINFQLNTINEYFQILFFKISNKQILPQISYVLLWDAELSEGYSTMSDEILYYEISFVTPEDKKLVLAYCFTKHRVKKILELLEQNKKIRIIDRTQEKIGGQMSEVGVQISEVGRQRTEV